MKALKIFGAIVLVLAVIIGVLAFLAPTHTHLERTVSIEAPSDMVWENVNNFHSMQEWSPWAAMDTTQQTTYSDNDGEVGSTMEWEGEETGTGKQEITSMGEGSMVTHLTFFSPMAGEADATMNLVETEAGTDVTWSYDPDESFPGNMMLVFIDLEDMLGGSYQEGLENLKTMVEDSKANRTEFDGYTVMRETMESRTVIGIRDTVEWAGMKEFYMENLPKTAGAIAENGLKMAGMPMGLFFMWDEENQRADMLAGAPIASGSIEGFESYELSGDCLVIEYYGEYEGTGKAHEAMEKYMKWHGIEFGEVAAEEYVTDPTEGTDPSEILTKIIYPI